MFNKQEPIATDRFLFRVYRRCTSAWPSTCFRHLQEGDPYIAVYHSDVAGHNTVLKGGDKVPATDRVVHHSLIVEFGPKMKSVRAEEAARRNRIGFGRSNAAQEAES